MLFPAEVQNIFTLFKDNGFASYAVGGCVRDFLLKKTPADYDFATDALPGQVMEIFSGYKVIPTGIKHGTVTVFAGSVPVEITTFRIEGAYLDNRRPSSVFFSKSIEDDLARRDFTINAIAYSPFEGYIDVFEGRKDIECKLIRCVNNPIKRFSEDALRILRALRLAAELGFAIERDTEESIHIKKELLKNISAERINMEFTRLLMSEDADKFLQSYRDVIEVFFPEFKGNPFYMHKAGLMNQKKDLSVKLAFLFEPIADQRGTEKAIDAIKRLRYDAKTIKEVKKMLFYKNRTIVPGKKQIKLWMNRMGDVLFEKLLSLKGFDEDMQKQETIVKDILSKNECYSLQTLDIKGKDLIAYGAAEGEALGRILQALLFDVILNKVPNQKKKLLERAKHYMDDQ